VLHCADYSCRCLPLPAGFHRWQRSYDQPPTAAIRALPLAVLHCAECGLCCLPVQGFIDGIGPMASLPRPLAAAGVWVLRTEQLRMVSDGGNGFCTNGL
jgi:hypothetical protein